MLTAGAHIRGLAARSNWIARLLCLVTVLAVATLMAHPASSEAITPGALSQLLPPSNCVTEEEFSNTTGCGTLVPFGLNYAYQVQVSPDGKNAYSVAAAGDLIEYSRDPASGALTVIGCISSEPSSHPPCASKNATMNVTAVDEPAALAISPEGKSVYVVSQGGDANDLAAFSRNPETGLLTKVGCIAHEASGTECETQGAKGLNTPYGVTVSPDGNSVYVASYSDSAVAEFSRDGESGAVEQLPAPNDCISSIAVSECGTTVAAGLERAIGVVVSPDDKDVYVAAGGEYGEGAIVALEREAETGALTQLPGEAGCISTFDEACAHGTAINGPEDLVISPDGKNIYANSYDDSAVIELKRNPETGGLTQLGCLASSLAGETGPCSQAKSIANPLGVAISPGGQNLYVSSFGEAAVAAFERLESGGLAQLPEPHECVTTNSTGCGKGSTELIGLDGPRRLTVSPDGLNVYVAGQSASTVVELDRAQATPVISYPTFSGATGLQLNGAASITGSSLQLTPAEEFTSGTAFSRTQIQTTGSFETEFELKMHGSNTLESFGTYADGMAFVLQPDSAEQLGEVGGDLGYSGITPSAVVQFDIYQNTYDPPVPYISFMEDGNPEVHLAESGTLPFGLYGETPVHAWISYDAASHELSVYAAPSGAGKPTEPLVTYEVNLAELLHSNYTLAGFTAGTGSGDAIQEVLNWQLSSERSTEPVSRPTVESITPNTGPFGQGTPVTIKGTGFLPGAKVEFSGAESGEVVVVSETEITTTTPPGLDVPAEVVVRDAGGTSTGGPEFTPYYIPTVQSITPSSGTTSGGTPVTIRGTGFLAGAHVEIGAVQEASNVVVVSETEITATTPPGFAGSDEVVVTDAHGTSNDGPSYTFEELEPPTVTSLEPEGGPSSGGTRVTINGTGFDEGAEVQIGDEATEVDVLSSEQILATTTATPPGKYEVVVRDAHGVSSDNPSFTYISPGIPLEDSITPSSGPAAGGTPVTIEGSRFAAGSTVSIGGQEATEVDVVSEEEITARTPPGTPGLAQVTVTDFNGSSAEGAEYTYVAPPDVESITPSEGPLDGGTPVKIKGKGFLAGSTVKIGGSATNVKVVSSTEITAMTPAGEGSPEVIVSDEGGPSTGGPTYSYVPAPTVTSVEPTHGPAAGGTPVKIKGTGFLAGATVAIGSGASSVVIDSEEEITATTAATTVGAYEVSVTDAGGKSTGGPKYTYQAGACSDAWLNPVAGSWNTAADWSTGSVPTASDNVCITVPGEYTVTLTGSASVNSLTLGGTSGATRQTLLVGGPAASGTLDLAADSSVKRTGVLNMETAAGGESIVKAPAAVTIDSDGEVVSSAKATNYLEANLTNEASGTVEIKSGELNQDENTTTTNEGKFEVASGATFAATSSSDLFVNKGSLANGGTVSLSGNASWTQEAGTKPQSGGPVSIFNSGKLTDVSGAGSFDLIDTAVLSGTVPNEQTVTADAIPSHDAEVKISGTVTNEGTLALESPAGGGEALLAGSSSHIDNKGLISAETKSTNENYLQTNLTNEASGTVQVKSGELNQNENTTTTNEGAFKVEGGATFAASSSKDEFANRGSLANTGTVSLSGNASWTQEAGAAAETGNAVSIFNSGELTDVSGAGSFDLIDTAVLSGTVPKKQKVTADAIESHNALIKISGTVTNEGTLVLDSPSKGGEPAFVGNTAQIDNDGLFVAGSESSNEAYLQTNLTNAAGGTVEIKSGELNQDENTTTTNEGKFEVASGATFAATSSSDLFVNKGPLANGGTVSLSGNASWTQEAGTKPQSGGPVSIFNSGKLTDVSGAGSFDLIDTAVLSGTVPNEQTVTADAIPSHDAEVKISGTVTNEGTLALESPAGGGEAAPRGQLIADRQQGPDQRGNQVGQ